MGVFVRGYTKHVNGKLVTVHGYQANNRDGLVPTMAVNKTSLARQLPDRNSRHGIAGPGLFASSTPDIVRGEGGLNAYVFHAGMHDAQIRWRRTVLPIRGAYHIPED